ncbi:MAG: fibrobacter succinogenes major paralogous domain-containing protein, partial [Bacteroidales bacterium]|nr:fibrobacter succinogenes major paralogous domain-containing protein [Bacteroidales bacterium]
NVYNIIKIGDQEWLDMNLNVTRYRNGDAIVNALGGPAGQGGWINYGNLAANGDIYGKLYNSYAVHDQRGLAPEGWHVATLEEWTELINFLGGFGEAGGKLKEVGLDHWLDPNTDATDDYGFKALPGGYAGGTGSYMGNYASFWTSSYIAEDTYSTYNLYLYYNNPTIEQDWDFGGSGYSVRCVRD